MITPGLSIDEMSRLTADELADVYERSGLPRQYGLSVHYMLHSGLAFD